MKIKIPNSKYDDYYNQSLFETIWYIYFALSIFFLVLGIRHAINDNWNFLTIFGALAMSTFSLIYMSKKKSYEVPVVLGIIAGTILFQLSIWLLNDYSNMVDTFWVLIIVLFSFFSLGPKWGSFIFVLNLFSLLAKYAFGLKLPYEIEITEINPLTTAVNIIFASMVIGFLIFRMVKSSVIANHKLVIANEQLQNQNQVVRAQSDEKTALLQEIHHRVKNNLQVVSSMIRLQSADVEDPNAQKIFEASVGRISAMALIHEKMYQRENVSKINLENYLRNLAEDILKSYVDQVKVNFSIHSELEIIGNRTVVPLALIFNELITNSLKHGFRSKKMGNIQIKIKLKGTDEFVLEYADNGEWKERLNSNSLGMDLIDSFTEQLDGKYVRNSSAEGTSYYFRLRNID